MTIRIYPPAQSAVDLQMQPGEIVWSSVGGVNAEQARAFAKELLAAADELDKLNAAIATNAP